MGLSLRNIGRKIRDVFDANTEEDKRKRQAAGQPIMYADQQRAKQQARPVQNTQQSSTYSYNSGLQPQAQSTGRFASLARDVALDVDGGNQARISQAKAKLDEDLKATVKPKAPEKKEPNAIDSALDAGRSWESIAQENRLPVGAVKDYSQATRPNYGISDIARPKQSPVNKLRDILDANTDSDKFRRQEENKANVASPEKFKPVVLEKPGNIYSSTIGENPAKLAEAITLDGKIGKETRDAEMALQENYVQSLAKAREKISNPNTSQEERARWIDHYIKTYNEAAYSNEKLDAKLSKEIKDFSPEKGIVTGGLVGLDLASLGLTGVTGKEIVKQGFKQGLKSQGRVIASNAAVNSLGGAGSAYVGGQDLEGILKSAAISGTLGTVADVGLASAGAVVGGGIKKAMNSVDDKARVKFANTMINSFDIPEAPTTKAPKIPETKLVADMDWNQIQQKNNAARLDKLIEQRKTVPPDSPQAKNIDLEINKALYEADQLAQQEIENVDISRAKLRESQTSRPAVALKQQPETNFVLDSQGRQVNPETGEYIGTPTKQLVPGSQAPAVDIPAKVDNTPLQKTPSIVDGAETGTMAKTFYDSKRGNNKINFKELKDLGERVAIRVEQEFKDIGSDFETVARKTQEAELNGARSLDEVDLTPEEKNVWRNMQSEMEYMRRRASLGKRKMGDGDRGELYFPHEKPGTYPTSDTLFEGFRVEKPGNEYKRGAMGNQLALDELNYSTDVIAGYVTRYGDTKLLQQERITRSMAKQYPDATPDSVRIAADKVIALQDRVNRLETKITVGGLGRKVSTVDGVTGAYIDIPAEMAKIGKSLDRPQTDIVGTTKGFTNGERINSVTVDENGVVHTVGDYLGLNQHHDATAYAGTQVEQAAGDRLELANLVGERLQNNYRMLPEDIEYAVQSIARIREGIPEEVVRDRVSSIYKNAAKQQLMDSLQGVNIVDKTLRKDVSQLSEQLLREGSIEQKTSAKVVNSIMMTTNTIFRKFNISSALNELSDLTSFVTVYGKGTKLAAPDMDLVRQLGLGDIDPAIEPYLRQVESGVPVRSVMNTLKKANKGSNLYTFVEHYKAGVLAKTALEHYTAKGITGDELTSLILRDYRNLALPVDAFTKTFLNSAPLYTQYMSWGARNLQKEGRLLMGQFDAGIMKDKSMSQRVARDLYANLPAKTVFWLASNGLKGTAILGAFGLTDFTGLSQADYSGIAEEDKTGFDKYVAPVTNVSTTGSILNTIVQSWEKEQLKESDKYANADYNPYESNSIKEDAIKLATPQALKNVVGVPGSEQTKGAWQMMDEGYSANKAGKVQFEAPTDPYNIGKAFLFGKNQTKNAREYSGNKNIYERVKGAKDVADAGKKAFVGVRDMAKEQTNQQERKYNRPLTDDYSKAYTSVDKVDKDARTALLNGGRNYNKLLDDLKTSNPDLYNSYIKSMDGNHVKPEYWRNISMNAEGGKDLTTWKMIVARKQQLKKDLGTEYDPVYDLPTDQAASLLRLRSTTTGDNLAARNTLNKEQWYKDLKDRRSAYFEKNPGSDEEFKSTKRVKEWDKLDDQLTGFYYDADKVAKEGDPAWSKDFPLVYQQKAINDKYGFDSAQSRNFFKANGDGYKAQKENYDKAQLAVINKMRKIEGEPPMSWDGYQQATEVAKTDGDTKKNGYSKGGSGGGKGSSKTKSSGSAYKYAVKLSKGEGFAKPKISVKAGKKAPRRKSSVKPKVALKKSSV